VYQYIREKNIDIELEILFCYKGNCSNRIQRLVEQFYINKYDSVNNGFNIINAFTNQKKYYEKNKDKILKKNKKYREENKDKIKNYHIEYSKKYYQENKKKKKNYYEENKDKIKNYHIEYCAKNKEQMSKKRKVKINCCLCGSLISKYQIKRHQRSKKCKSLSKVY